VGLKTGSFPIYGTEVAFQDQSRMPKVKSSWVHPVTDSSLKRTEKLGAIPKALLVSHSDASFISELSIADRHKSVS